MYFRDRACVKCPRRSARQNGGAYSEALDPFCPECQSEPTRPIVRLVPLHCSDLRQKSRPKRAPQRLQ
jgi:hypothetical protein